jgi:hypothetical protein
MLHSSIGRHKVYVWVVLHWFELITVALLILNLWFVSSVLGVLRETNRWLTLLSRVQWDRMQGPEGSE